MDDEMYSSTITLEHKFCCVRERDELRRNVVRRKEIERQEENRPERVRCKMSDEVCVVVKDEMRGEL